MFVAALATAATLAPLAAHASGPPKSSAISPGVHIPDLWYTFNSPAGPASFPETQNAMPTAIASFVKTSGGGRSLVQITGTDTEPVTSPINNTGCDGWRGGFSS
ncbi:hypothetical protein B0I35DRAFT_407598 [Stachybotrys elegans]|uniref:Uncharacterized protein n=1 Tax=Stachybotrys elegans TaxID=80388 RepID=A0A8K0SUN4_9HYPO|nr:hypothetical protein B0I35DRAFT_407598 [Stachybotrys elegans]